MGSSVEVNSSNYNSEVVEKSFEKPVIVDFFATWCGPCQILKPMLEKLAGEYDFVLAKIDIDQNQDLANKFGIEGVPDVRIVTNGDMIPGFVGVLPEEQLRELMGKLNLKSGLEVGLENARKAIAAGDGRQAKQIFDELFSQYPDSPKVVIEAAKFLVSVNQLEAATKMVGTIGQDNREYYDQAQAIKALISFKEEVNNPGESELDQQFAQAAKLILMGDYEPGLKILLSMVEKHRKYRDDGARKDMLAVFNLLGNNHPLTKEYQNKLMLTLY